MIPRPERICPHCSNAIPIGSNSCSVCGYGRVSGASIAIWVILLILIGVPAAMMGGCFLLLAGSTPRPASGSSGIDPVWFVLSIIGVCLPVFFVIMISRSKSK